MWECDDEVAYAACCVDGYEELGEEEFGFVDVEPCEEGVVVLDGDEGVGDCGCAVGEEDCVDVDVGFGVVVVDDGGCALSVDCGYDCGVEDVDGCCVLHSAPPFLMRFAPMARRGSVRRRVRGHEAAKRRPVMARVVMDAPATCRLVTGSSRSEVARRFSDLSHRLMVCALRRGRARVGFVFIRNYCVVSEWRDKRTAATSVANNTIVPPRKVKYNVRMGDRYMMAGSLSFV